MALVSKSSCDEFVTGRPVPDHTRFGEPVRLSAAGAFRGSDVLAQLRRISAWTVSGCVALNPPALAERPEVDGVEPELIEQTRDCLLGRRVIARDRQRSSVR
jgi:hypothetical protein